ncbi:hypothetical protein BGZ57DRAFT_895644 [Hyaloscypha finlandica]|nr:hypothetical protein BGZ57DRAFT_895644 [Hyaloscypha finlandica]
MLIAVRPLISLSLEFCYISARTPTSTKWRFGGDPKIFCFPTKCYTDTKMAYYTSGQWPVVQTSTWPGPAPYHDWENSTMNGSSPESSSSNSPSQGYYEPVDAANMSSYTASSYSQQGATSSSAYYSHDSEVSSISYLPTTTDDIPYYPSGDVTSYGPSALTSPTQYSSEPVYQDDQSQYDMTPESEPSSSGRRKSTSNSSSKQKRQLQNRLAQRAFRERQARQQEELHRKVRHLKEQYEDLEGKYQQLRGEHERCGQKEHRRDCNCGRA